MLRFVNRSGGVRGLVALCAVAVLAAACDFHYRAAAGPALDEVVVQTTQSVRSEFNHPAHLSAPELASILKEVRVQFKSNWLQRLITGPLQTVPLFDDPTLAHVVPLLAEALGKAGTQDRVVFYVAQRRSNDRRDVTSGALFVKGRGLILALANHQNRVDVVPGLAAYDRQTPEVAVAPQQFSLVFSRNEFVIRRGDDGAIVEALETELPALTVDYAQFLQRKSQSASVHGNVENKETAR
ncbi:MAG: hypothetical protein EPO02_01115 [Nitrospirae bacterium]|nr:MAG: hypothetical protein EPO02_01115 [Nitrospirota bacterium]